MSQQDGNGGGGRTGNLLRAIGPGILFAGAAVGVSHLVQSTRAGASYGFALVGFVIAANLVKYPAFRFGPQYAAATGTSLLEGYRRQGAWALVVYAIATLLTMFTVQAAVTLVTAGLVVNLLGIDDWPFAVAGAAIVLTVLCAVFLGVGRYAWLERVGKVTVALLTLFTLVATGLCLQAIDWSQMHFWPSEAMFADPRMMLFVAGLVGWMPSAIDVSVWQSIWTLERRAAEHRATTGTDGDDEGAESSAPPPPTVAGLRGAVLDFHVGYIGAGVLALCFLTLGAAIMLGREIDPRPATFSAQLVSLYGETLGDWSRPIIGAAAFLVMFTTTLTVIDGFPRALSVLRARFTAPEDPAAATAEKHATRRTYWISLVVLGAGSLLIILQLKSQLKLMVDIATTASFLTAPVLALLNHRAAHGEEVTPEFRPALWLTVFSWVAILVQLGFAIFYVTA